MTNNPCKKESSYHCFSSIIRQMVCGQNLPTHPSPCGPMIAKKSGEVTTLSNPLSRIEPSSSQVQVQARDKAQGPSIVARLMGLESLPESTNSYESLFRSKSLNSLHFYPEFNLTRASFHRRGRTSASFHEQSHYNLLAKVDENLEQNGCLELKKPQKGSHGIVKQKEGLRENVVKLKGNERRISRKRVNNNKRYEDRFSSSESNGSNKLGKYYLREKNITTTNEKRKLSVKKNKEKRVKINGNVGPNNNVLRKVNYIPSEISDKIGRIQRKDGYKEEMNVELFQSDSNSRSPISVLDHHHCHLFDSPTKENERQAEVPKSKKKDKSPKKMGRKQKLDMAEEQVAHYLVDFLAQIHSVVEDHVRDSIWMTKYQRSKDHLTEELCAHFGDQVLECLLLELMDELFV